MAEDTDNHSEARLQRRFERERKAREQAEAILEEKSRELFEKNQELQELSNSLEAMVVKRTQELLETRDQALAAANAKSEFLANMSHELRTPMNGVLGMLTLIQGTQLNAEQNDFLRIAKSSGQLLLSVINDILDFSKIDAGKMDLEDLVFAPAGLLQEVVSPLTFAAQEKAIDLDYQCDDAMPPALWGDPTRLKQIITNLVSNAVKFTERGSVTVSMQLLPEHYAVVVKDTGMGMDSAQLAHIFEAFGQGDSSITRTHGGTGLGLTITNQLCQMMDGQISVESEPGIGTQFTVLLPLRVADAEQLEQQGNQFAQGLMFDGQSILLVEDNKVNQQIALHLLEESGLTVSLAENGQEALEAVQQQSFEAVLMDLQMPVMDGLEATRQIRRLAQPVGAIPIVAMTAHASTEHIDECMMVGMNAHTTKPIDIDIVLNTLAQWITPSDRQLCPADKSANALPHIKGMNVEEAAKRVRGNEDLLFELLGIFVQSQQDLVKTVNGHLDQDDVHRAKIALHTLKGSAANISAMEVSNLASEAEQLAKQKQVAPLRALLPKLKQSLQHLCSNIVSVLEKRKLHETIPGQPISDEHWHGCLSQIDEHIYSDMAKADDILSELKQFALDDDQQSLFATLQQAMGEFDMDKIHGAIQDSVWFKS